MSEVSKRALRTMAVVRWLLLAGIATAAAWAWWEFAPRAGSEVKRPDRYYCSMHPEVRSPDPGICPICSMTLEPIPIGGPSGGPSEAAMSEAEPEPEPRVPVMLTLERRALVGIALARATQESIAEDATWPGTLDIPEAAWAEVRARTEGYIEKVVPLESGASVEQGETLAWLDAPEVAKARAELAALRRLEPVDPSAVAAAQARLRRLGDRGASGWLEVKAPIAGMVFERTVAPGGYVQPESVLFKLADVRTLRAVAAVPADDANAVAAALGTEAQPGEAHAFWRNADGSEIALVFDRIEPQLDPATRTARLRFVLPNPSGLYRPGALGAVILRRAAHPWVLVPRDAVVPLGRGALVFVETAPGVLSPTAVETGPLFGERRAIRAGLAAGQKVVVRGTFLVDAESRFQAALAPASAAPHAHEGGTP